MKAESPMRRILLNMNFIAFFFGFIYFFVLGLWRKNLALLGIAVVVMMILGSIESELSFAVSTGVNCAFAAIWSMMANYAYYLKETVNSQSWNPFEGFF
ncbi:DUF2628 domain-containing protein [Photorhabdus heterorhabditis]|uniref:DUF2628 domain-containing protein n=1 Tax=Photorhabdus heterorhabditis TaxID=880156 RepID=UPI000ADB6B08|nr:DUF2628 domain-containing protein [Photorhabdus heterorhabditis]